MGIPEGTDMKPPAVYFIHRWRLLIFGLKQHVLFFNYVPVTDRNAGPGDLYEHGPYVVGEGAIV
jgi:hypothetical protein